MCSLMAVFLCHSEAAGQFTGDLTNENELVEEETDKPKTLEGIMDLYYYDYEDEKTGNCTSAPATEKPPSKPSGPPHHNNGPKEDHQTTP